MSTSDKIKKLMNEMTETLETLAQKEEEIRHLKEQNRKLREENDSLKQQQQFKTIPSDQYTVNRNAEVNRKASELRKAIDDFLGEHPNRRPFQPMVGLNHQIFQSSNVDVNKPSTSTSEIAKTFRTGQDEQTTSGTSHIINHGNENHVGYNNNQEPNHDFSSSRLGSDHEIVSQATEIRQPLPFYSNHGHNSYVPTTMNNLGGQQQYKRFMNGMNNNGNNRNRNMNSNNNNNKFTIFIAWTGMSTEEQLRELFDQNDVADIRYTSPKQFAHVDFKSDAAMKKAMALNGVTKNETQGTLRVETGKPRSSNNTAENGQRLQQNKNYNRQNNKNPNGYNNIPQKGNNSKYNPNYNNNHHNRSNNNHQFPSYVNTDDKESNTNGGTNSWQNNNYANSSSNQQEQTAKPAGETISNH